MAGFQKFPVPRALYIDTWAYNKRWIGNSLCLFIGSFFVGISFYRYNLYRTSITSGVGSYIDPNQTHAAKPMQI